MLTDWHCENRDFPKARETAKRMARLAPRSAIPLGYLADVQMKLGEKHDAWGTLRRAFEVDPTYRFAGDRLLDRHLEEGEFKEAEEVVTLMETHTPGASALLARLRLHCRRNRREDALAVLKKICVLPADESFAVSGADRAFQEAGWARHAEDFFLPKLGDPATNPEVGACWVRRFAARRAWKYGKQLAQLDPTRELTRVARVAYLEVLGENDQVRDLLRFVRKERAVLRLNAQSWGTVGYAFFLTKRYGNVIAWLDDWRQRPGVTAWMLQNLSGSLRELGRDAEALAVNRHAMTLKPDHTTVRQHLWLAFDAALRGDGPAADAVVAEFREQEEADHTRALHALVVAVRAVQTAAPAERRSVVKKHHRGLSVWESSGSDLAPSLATPVLFRARQRALRVMYRTAERPFLAWLYGWLPQIRWN
jgi:tetratricopeptide (TPR) repeat protein